MFGAKVTILCKLKLTRVGSDYYKGQGWHDTPWRGGIGGILLSQGMGLLSGCPCRRSGNYTGMLAHWRSSWAGITCLEQVGRVAIVSSA